MKIERELIGTMDIAEFADRHGLVMMVKERPTDGRYRFYALFKNVELISGGCLISTFGNGATEHEAISDYARIISLNLIAVSAFAGSGIDLPVRRELRVPRLHYTPSEVA